MTKNILFLLLFLIARISYSANSDNENRFTNKIFAEHIKTMRIYIQGNELSYPVIELNGKHKIEMEFDLISDQAKDYSYSLIHCNADWQKSDIFAYDFIDGFEENIVNEYSFSENTRVKFVNYKITLPNNDVNMKISGNYAIRVFDSHDKNKTIATACFSVYEPLVNVDAEIVRPINAEFSNSGQEVRFTIQHNDLQIINPFSDILVKVYQNNRPSKTLKNLKPTFVKNNELVYNFTDQNLLSGGNEFRTFSTTDLNIPGQNIYACKFVDSLYHVQIRNDERRSYKKYFWHEDTNGKFVIFSNSRNNQSVEADYTFNHFYLMCEQPILDSKVYVIGGFCNWNILPENELIYDFDNKAYRQKILMKQGVYDYVYICQNNYTKKLDESIMESSHYKTENDYLIFVYHKLNNDFTHKLIGFHIVNSQRK